MGYGMNLTIMLLCVHIFLAIAYPVEMQSSEYIQNLGDIGVDVEYNETLGGYDIITSNETITNITDMTLGQRISGAVTSGLNTLSGGLYEVWNGIIWLKNMILTPFTVMDMFPFPWWIKLLFKTVFGLMWFVAIISLIRGIMW